jgi:hypothetical protein
VIPSLLGASSTILASPIVLEDNLWVPGREDFARIFVVPIGDIHIFIGEINPANTAETNFWQIVMAEKPPYGRF